MLYDIDFTIHINPNFELTHNLASTCATALATWLRRSRAAFSISHTESKLFVAFCFTPII